MSDYPPIRCVCANCKKVNFRKMSRSDLAEIVYLCKHCDSAYYSWMHKTGRVYADDFLKTYAARQARATAPQKG